MKGMMVETHREGCGGLFTVARGHWDHPWTVARYEWLGRERTGKPHSGCGIKFLVYQCGDPACPAKIIFLAETLERNFGLRARTDGVKERELDAFWFAPHRKMSWEYEDDPTTVDPPA